MPKLILLLLLVAVPAVRGIEPVSSFPRPSWFQQHFAAPRTRIELQAPQALSDYVVNGTLELSLRAYLELVMRNNTDILVNRLLLETAANNLSAAYGVYDPSIATHFSYGNSTAPSINSLQNQTTYTYSSQIFTSAYSQLLSSGTGISVQFSPSRQASNASYNIYNPTFSSSLYVNVSQPLLQNRWGVLNKMSILSARTTQRMSRYSFESQLSSLVAAAESVYWNAVSARENLALAKKYLEQNASALSRARKMVEAGALLPLELYQPQSSYASAQLNVLQAQRSLTRAENALRQQIGADLDAAVRDAPISLTETLDITPVDPPEKQEAVAAALKARPDLRASELALDADDIGIRRATESLRPSLSLTGGYTSQGVGGTYVGGGSAAGGMGDALGQMFRFGFPVYSFGVSMTLPVRDRAGAAALANAQIAKKQDALRLRGQQQQVRRDVLDAVETLETARASLEQARLARDYAAKRLEAVQKQYELGTTQMYFVLNSQTDLSAAENTVLSQLINYRVNLVNLYRMTGRLLEERRIAVE